MAGESSAGKSGPAMSAGREEIAGIVLAAGQSTRMGRLKQTLPWGRRTVVGAVIETLMQAGVDHIVLVVGYKADQVLMADVEAEDISTAAMQIGDSSGTVRRLPQIKVAYNPRYEMGMSSSVAVGMRAVPAQCCAAVVALADQPMVGPKVVKRLIEEWRRTSRLPEGCPLAAVPVFRGRRGHPILLSARLRGQVEGLGELESGDGVESVGGFEGSRGEVTAGLPAAAFRTLRDVIGWARENGGVLEVAVNDASILEDLDYPSDYERLRPKGGGIRLWVGGIKRAWERLKRLCRGRRGR